MCSLSCCGVSTSFEYLCSSCTNFDKSISLGQVPLSLRQNMYMTDCFSLMIFFILEIMKKHKMNMHKKCATIRTIQAVL